jgi:hypothetical protein
VLLVAAEQKQLNRLRGFRAGPGRSGENGIEKEGAIASLAGGTAAARELVPL